MSEHPYTDTTGDLPFRVLCLHGIGTNSAVRSLLLQMIGLLL